MRRVAFVRIEQGQSGNGFFRIGIELHRDLEFALRLLQIVVQAVKPAEQEVVVHISGLDLDDFFVLLDGQLEHVLGSVAVARHIAERPQINPAQAVCELQDCSDRA